MRHTFVFGHSRPHRAHSHTRQEVCIVGYRDGFVALAKTIWRGIIRAIAASRQRRLERELSLHGVEYPDSHPPRQPLFIPDKWDY
jgi:hypothetical protein